MDPDDADACSGPELGATARTLTMRGTLPNLGHFGDDLEPPETGAALDLGHFGDDLELPETSAALDFSANAGTGIGTGAAAGTSGPFTGSEIGGVLVPGIAGTSGPPKMR